MVDECINRLPKKEVLNTNGVFVVDTGTEVFCWIGKASGARARKHGLRISLVRRGRVGGEESSSHFAC